MVIGKRYLKCKRCNRKLKNDEAKVRGYGSHCWQVHQMEVKKQSKTLLDIAIEIESKTT